MNVQSMYATLSSEPSDINEHLVTLRKYAEECDHVTEMGVRWVVSTFALVIAKPKTLISIDIIDPRDNFENWNSTWQSGKRLESIIEYAKENNINYKFIRGDTTKISIDETDMLFIDTLHEYEQTSKELKLHADKVKKYLVFHDTELFKYRNERIPDVVGTGKENIGIFQAIEEFLQQNSQWKIHEVFTNCNGLTILKRES